jgi:protein TonB
MYKYSSLLKFAMQSFIKPPHQGRDPEFWRVFGMVLAVHLGLFLLVPHSPQLQRKLPPITIEIEGAPPVVQRGLEQSVSAQVEQPGGESPTPAPQKQAPTPLASKPRPPEPSDVSPDAYLMDKPVEKTLVAAPVPAESVVAALPGSPTPAIARGQAVVTQETVKTSEPDLQAAYKENPKPPYPKAAFRIGAEGTVEINVEVNPDGSVAAVKLAQSSGNEWLDQSALDTVKGWRFRSARRDGVLSKSFVRVPITFRLRAPR